MVRATAPKSGRTNGTGSGGRPTFLVVGFLLGWAARHFGFAYETILGATSPVATESKECETEPIRKSHTSSSDGDIERGLILPFERTDQRNYLPGKPTDTYTYFHNYMSIFGRETKSPVHFTTLPLLHIWPVYFEAYHNHWQRYRGKENVVFMEIGVQSGGKIPMLRDYFGPGLTYIGIDINYQPYV